MNYYINKIISMKGKNTHLILSIFFNHNIITTYITVHRLITIIFHYKTFLCLICIT
ncbi:unnamed protein product [Brugia timori]|uniref:Uncharacterized protein n=1 Tax=Brugia timori TaxID=42155 RepID=A0A0R3QD01_9BILA|nr:unnamed protein product [Brugia timori]